MINYAELIKNQSFSKEEIISDIINDNEKNHREQVGLNNRYKLIQASSYRDDKLSIEYDGVPIFARHMKSRLKVNHRLNNSFCRRIVSTKKGYMGKEINIMISEKEENEAERKRQDEIITNFKNMNSFTSKMSDIIGDACLMRSGYVLLYKDKDELEPRMTKLEPYECIVIKDAITNKPQYAIRYWKIKDNTKYNGELVKTEKIRVDFYDTQNVYHYISMGDINKKEYKFMPFTKDGQTEHVHMFKGFIPLIEFPNNTEKIGDVEQSLTLQDAYDVSLSDLSAEIAQLRLAYLVGKAVGKVDHKLLEQLEQTGILSCDDNGEWYFIEKNLNDDAIDKLRSTLEKNIYLFSNSVDFSDPEFAANMPIIAFKLKIKPLEESAQITENSFKESLRYMFECLNSYLSQLNKSINVNSLQFNFKRNLPTNTSEEIDNFVKLYNKVPDKIALSRLSFIDDIEEVLAMMEKEKEKRIEDFNEMQNNEMVNNGNTETEPRQNQ